MLFHENQPFAPLPILRNCLQALTASLRMFVSGGFCRITSIIYVLISQTLDPACGRQGCDRAGYSSHMDSLKTLLLEEFSKEEASVR